MAVLVMLAFPSGLMARGDSDDDYDAHMVAFLVMFLVFFCLFLDALASLDLKLSVAQ